MFRFLRSTYTPRWMGTWTPTRIRWVDRTLGSSTGASRVETDQGPAYAKMLGNPEGTQALFCEWVGTRAASWLGLPTFEVAIIDVERAGMVTYENGSRSLPGPAFVARAEEGAAWGGTTEELDAVENPEVLSGLIVLDTWLANCDRYRAEGASIRKNTRNVFLSGHGASKGRFRVLAIDHTHCFTCGRELNRTIRSIDRTHDARVYGAFPEFHSYVTSSSVRQYTRRLAGLTDPAAADFFSGLPAAWAMPRDIQAAIAEFLVRRAQFLADNLMKILVDRGVLEPELDLEA